MEKHLTDYSGRLGRKAHYEFNSDNAPVKPEPEPEQKPIYWVKADDVNEEIFDKIVDIYDSIYNKYHAEFIRPDFSNFSEKIARDGYVDWSLLSKNKAPLEARRQIGANGIFYVRFRTMPRGSSLNEAAPNPKRDEFQDKVDAIFLEKGLAIDAKDIR
jgi:hypothetical protein